MDPIRQAIVSALAADPNVTSKLSSRGAIYHQEAARSARTPYIVFSQNSGAYDPQFNGAAITRQLWLIKAIDENRSASAVEDIDAAVRANLSGKTLTLSDGHTAAVLPESDVSYSEPDGDRTFKHRGTIFRLVDP
jgi:hypothetical protein